MKYKISIAMAAYNSAPYIKNAMMSIFKQTIKKWELVIVLDGCKDNTYEVINNCIESYPQFSKQIKIYEHDENYGYGMALYNAINKCTADIIAIVDSDDALSRPESLEIMIKSHKEHPDASLIYSDYYSCDSRLLNPCITKNSDIKPNTTFLGKFRDGKYIGTPYNISHLKTFKKSYYNMTEGLDYTLKKAVDKDLVLKLEEVGKLVHIPLPLYYHRKNPSGITSTFNRLPEYEKRKIIGDKYRMYNNARIRRNGKTGN